MEVNRSSAPAVQDIVIPKFPAFSMEVLSGGIPVYFIRYGALPVVEVQWVFRAGHCYESQTGIAAMTARMLTEGTKKKNSVAIANYLDEYGAFIQANAGYEATTFTLSTLTRHLAPTFALLNEIIQEATLPEQEFKIEKSRALQNFEIEEQKTEFVARRRFIQTLFPAPHPYGSITDKAAIEKFELEQLRRYHKSHLQPSNGFIIIAGEFEPETFLELLSAQGIDTTHYQPVDAAQPPPPIRAQATRINETIPGRMQSSLRVGHYALPRKHPDYHAIKFATMLLGGYFGARLMQNIREEKGYTYGIYARWNAMLHDGYFGIGTDVANEYVEDTLVEIRKEINRMATDPFTDEELTMAKNYYCGKVLSNRETPSQIADILKNIILQEIDLDDLERGNQIIQALTAKDIMDISAKYLIAENLITVVAGG